MNAQKLNQKPNRLSYQKDYTKLESIFEAAVERMHRKRIIYYATDRIYSEDSRKFRARETFKETAWAKPVSTEDIKTEVIQLAKENVIPISDTILNDSPSLISFLELVGEDNIEMTEAVEEEALKQPDVKQETPNESQEGEAVKLKDLFDIEETDEVKQETSPEVKETVEALKLADLIPNAIEEEPEEIKEEPTVTQQVEPDESPLFLHYQEVRAELKSKETEEVFEDETLTIEESATEETKLEEQAVLASEETNEEVKQAPEELSLTEAEEPQKLEKDNDYLEADYDRFLEFSDRVLEDESIPEDMSLSELLASIQEDDSYLTRDETTSQVSETEVEPERLFERQETVQAETPVEDIGTTLEEKPLDEFNETTIQESPIDAEIRETKPKRRIQLDEVETQDLYNTDLKLTESETKEKKLSQRLIDKINEAKKEYMLSRISFFIALILTGVFVGLFFSSFNGIDYFSLILSLVGAFLVWDLSSKRILLMTGVIEGAVIASMIYMSYSTGMSLDYFHYVWLLIVPLLIGSSFIFKKSRENYASIVNGKDTNLETN